MTSKKATSPDKKPVRKHVRKKPPVMRARQLVCSDANAIVYAVYHAEGYIKDLPYNYRIIALQALCAIFLTDAPPPEAAPQKAKP